VKINLKRFAEILQQVNIANLTIVYYYLKNGRLFMILKMLFRQLFSNRHPRPFHLETALRLLKKKSYDRPTSLDQPIDIILPVYNGYEFLVTLVKLVFKNTRSDFRLIIVDDASTDSRIWPLLESVRADHPGIVLLLKNETNLGFVKTVNLAYQHTLNHFVLLNTDVEVPPSWLERLMSPITRDDTIASTTPFTNAGKICGFPGMGDNPLIESLSTDEIDSFFSQLNESISLNIPTGVGFCMGINRYVAEKIGMFDELAFLKGYGEENDWCMRAKNNGYKHVIVQSLFVYHRHGGSFISGEKKKLLDSNFRKLIRRYPDYLPAIYEFTETDPLRHIREFMVLLITGNTGKPKPVLVIGNNKTGKKASEKKQLLLNYSSQNKKYIMQYTYKNYWFEMSLNSLDELEMLFELIQIEDIIVKKTDEFPVEDNIHAAVKHLKNEKL
jgi:GT2 family glycosyltransferase